MNLEETPEIEADQVSPQPEVPMIPRVHRLIKEGDAVLVWFEEEVTYLVDCRIGKRVGIHCGKPLICDEWIGQPFGTKLKCDHGECYLLNPSMDDFMMKATRESGIVYPKDAGLLILKLGLKSGSKVLEIGTGSGSLTMALAQSILPEGRVHTFDRRTDLPQNAVKNLTRSGLMPYVTFHQRVAGQPFPENGFDAAVLDIPQPWEEVDVLKQAVSGGARVVSLTPTYNQIERCAEAFRAAGFLNVHALELLERPILARLGKTRPVQRMVSHTEFMVFATVPA